MRDCLGRLQDKPLEGDDKYLIIWQVQLLTDLGVATSSQDYIFYNI